MKFLPPYAVGLLALALGWSLVAAGVFLLAGLGWALISGAAPFVVLAIVIFRGIARAI
ncbi:MAG: hypothetical protein ACRYGK_01705 [Janthinobacterium lividum]